MFFFISVKSSRSYEKKGEIPKGTWRGEFNSPFKLFFVKQEKIEKHIKDVCKKIIKNALFVVHNFCVKKNKVFTAHPASFIIPLGIHMWT